MNMDNIFQTTISQHILVTLLLIVFSNKSNAFRFTNISMQREKYSFLSSKYVRLFTVCVSDKTEEVLPVFNPLKKWFISLQNFHSRLELLNPFGNGHVGKEQRFEKVCIGYIIQFNFISIQFKVHCLKTIWIWLKMTMPFSILHVWMCFFSMAHATSNEPTNQSNTGMCTNHSMRNKKKWYYNHGFVFKMIFLSVYWSG